jgi:hypothetical protein
LSRTKEYAFRKANGGQERELYIYENIVTVARSVSRDFTAGNFLPLTKTILADGTVIPFAKVSHYDLHKRPVMDLDELSALLAKVICDPRCCLVRSVPKDDEQIRCVRRICRDDNSSGPPTLIEWPQNWYALDIDNYARSTGNIELDACRVLLALPPVFRDARCIALATSSYGIKKGICLRLLFWNDAQITAHDLRRYFKACTKVADLGLFNPAQCIYVAKPIFPDRSDPVTRRLVEVNKQGTLTDIKHELINFTGSAERWYTKQQAKAFTDGIFQRVAAAEYQAAHGNSRHQVLIREAHFMGKLIGQEHFDRDYGYDLLWAACETWDGPRDQSRDIRTINDGLDRGIRSMGF